MDSPKLARLLDLPFQVEATLPGHPVRVSQLMNLSAGSLIATPLRAGETVNVFAGNTYIGSGELSVVNGRNAVRIVRLGGKK